MMLVGRTRCGRCVQHGAGRGGELGRDCNDSVISLHERDADLLAPPCEVGLHGEPLVQHIRDVALDPEARDAAGVQPQLPSPVIRSAGEGTFLTARPLWFGAQANLLRFSCCLTDGSATCDEVAVLGTEWVE